MPSKPTPSQAFSQAISRQARGREVVPVRADGGGIAFVRVVDLEAAQAAEAAAIAAASPVLGRSDAGAGADMREPAESPEQKMDRLIRRVAEPWTGRLGDDLVLVDS